MQRANTLKNEHKKMSNSEIILISISGEDKPGVTTAITEILSAYDATILDIGQADIHHTLSLGILFKMSDRTDSEIYC